MSTPKTYKAKWRNDKAEQKYRDLDEAGWKRATESPPVAIDVATSFGPTRAYQWPGDGPAIVFLHGMGDTSVRWIPFAEQLDDHDVYAIDIMGDVGRSTPEVGFSSAADYATWLGETIQGLGITMPHVVGHSLGGYIALSYAMGPDRVTSTIAFDPVGVVDLRLVRFMAWGFGNMLASFTPGPIRRRLARRLRFPLLLDKVASRIFLHGQRNHPPKMPPFPVFTDDELALITNPLLVLAGAESSAFDVKRMVERVNTTVSGADARLIPDAGHALTHSHFDECLAALRSTLTPAH